MKIFGRDLKRIFRAAPKFPKYLFYFAKCLFLFKNPIDFLFAYLGLKAFPSKTVELRNGLKIGLSPHPHDIVTIFVIFIRRDYGEIKAGSVIVDIGANIGVFALYAVSHGASKVFAYEPNSQSFNHLLNNIKINNLENVIDPYKLAVTKQNNSEVRFPIISSMYNSIITDQSITEYEVVKTINLDALVNEKNKIDLLKIDCEGAEYEILFSSLDQSYEKIVSIRMEFHLGQIPEVCSFLNKLGFEQIKLNYDSEDSGNVWYTKTSDVKASADFKNERLLVNS